jgi:hypothetical protein
MLRSLQWEAAMLAEIFLLRLELMAGAAAASSAKLVRSRFVPYVAPRVELSPLGA